MCFLLSFTKNSLTDTLFHIHEYEVSADCNPNLKSAAPTPIYLRTNNLSTHKVKIQIIKQYQLINGSPYKVKTIKHKEVYNATKN